MRRSRLSRLARGSAAATVATFVALVSHVSAGGGVPGWLGIVTPWVLSVAVCTLLAGRTLSVTRLAVAVAASQALFHVLFVLGSFSLTTGGGGHHVHTASMTMPHEAADTVAALHGDALMWVGHAIAAVITIAALHRGERAVRSLLALVRTAIVRMRVRLALVLLGAGADARRPHPDFVSPTRPARRMLLLSATPRRGPPALRVV